MLGGILLAAAFQVGPFYAQDDARELKALSPFWSTEGETTDVLWPVFTAHRDWWRFCWFVHGQDNPVGHQFEIIPLWFNGTARDEGYWGLFPLWGRHPHVLLMYDWEFALWPVWMRYRNPKTGERLRKGAEAWVTSNNVLWPFVHWRDDGAWGVWPFYELNYRRESTHQAALWPIVTWAAYREDRDTAGAGTSWMVWPLYGRVRRARERQDLVLPPLFSWAEVDAAPTAARGNSCPDFRLNCPWPIFSWEKRASRSRVTVLPLYERIAQRRYADGGYDGGVTRFGWRLVELYWRADGALEESRVFPFWVKNDRYLRVWPFWEREGNRSRCLALFPMRWVDAVDRNWSPWWTFYEAVEEEARRRHYLLWGLIRWESSRE